MEKFEHKIHDSIDWKTRVLSTQDYSMLLELVKNSVGKSYIPAKSIHALFLLISNCNKIGFSEIDNDIIAMNTEFIISTELRHKLLVKIVFPEKISGRHDISIFSSIGIACLGSKESSYVNIKQDNFDQKIIIEKILSQPKEISRCNANRYKY